MTGQPFDVARVRGLFPTLGDGWIHLDPQAGMQVPDSVSSAVARGFRKYVSAPGGVYPDALASREVIADSRRAIADLVNGEARGVVLGPDRGVLINTLAESLSSRVWLGSEIILSRLDDEENLLPWERAADRLGAKVRYAEIDIETGELPAWQFDDLVTPLASVIAISMASSAIGTLTDVRSASRAIHGADGLLVVDASNAVPYFPVDIHEVEADVMVVSPDRWGGPRGCAALVFRDPDLLDTLRCVAIDSTARGPEKLEMWLHNYSSLAGIVASVEHLANLSESASGSRRERIVESMTSLQQYQQRLLRYLINGISASTSVNVIGSARWRIPLISFTVSGVPAAKVAKRLADNGICAISNMRSRVLDGLGVQDFGGAVTIGLGPYTTPYEVDQLVRALGSLV